MRSILIRCGCRRRRRGGRCAAIALRRHPVVRRGLLGRLRPLQLLAALPPTYQRRRQRNCRPTVHDQRALRDGQRRRATILEDSGAVRDADGAALAAAPCAGHRLQRGGVRDSAPLQELRAPAPTDLVLRHRRRAPLVERQSAVGNRQLHALALRDEGAVVAADEANQALAVPPEAAQQFDVLRPQNSRPLDGLAGPLPSHRGLGHARGLQVVHAGDAAFEANLRRATALPSADTV
mmetsp:Transcript_93523/g.269296  ORF Transcript_93523/g.269296 Transcript_93523/m.269296 type:complete len:236 (+) Transcript_93523:1032-1739(+)